MNYCLLFIALTGSGSQAQDCEQDPTELSPPASSNSIPIATLPASEGKGVQWKSLFRDTFTFILIENGFRYLTEEGTRHPHRPFFQGYLDSVTNLHGWSDGDPFYVNYVGHPMQGAVSGFLWIANDRRYRYAEFGANPEYWKSRLRAAAFAFVYSEQSEIGLISEASIGNVQAYYPQTGFVDHVVTPVIGLGWLVTEDAIDHYLIRMIERRTGNRVVRAVVRGGLNPSRSFANVITGQLPWARVRDTEPQQVASERISTKSERPTQDGVPTFEFAANAFVLGASGSLCVGGGATAAFRVGSAWQIAMDVSGCTMSGLSTNLSGDSLSYMTGPRWTPGLPGHWQPYVQLLVGGNKLTQELNLPDVKIALSSGSTPPTHKDYSRETDTNGFAASLGAGLDLKINNVWAFRLVDAEYTRSWVRNLDGFKAPNGFQITTGVVLRFGAW